MTPPHICIVIPTYNEVESIKHLIISIKENLSGYYIHIFVVDDGSTDGTREAVPHFDIDFNIEVINRGKRNGFGSALVEGLKTALVLKPSSVVTMDADLSHDPCEISNLVALSTPGAIVLGSRYINGGSYKGFNFPRRQVSLVANWLAKSLVKGVSDCTSGFRCYAPDVIEAILPKLNSVGYDIQVESLFYASRLGFNIVETPIHYRRRFGGKSKLSLIEILRFMNLISRLDFY